MEWFRKLLPSRYDLDNETAEILKGPLANLLLGLEDQDDAIALFERAVRHPHETTIKRLEEKAGLMFGANFQVGSSTAVLVKAFAKTTLVPHMVKFDDKAEREANHFSSLGLSWEEAPSKNIVPMRLEKDVKGKCVLVMPSYECDLDSLGTTFHANSFFEVSTRSETRCPCSTRRTFATWTSGLAAFSLTSMEGGT